MKVTKRENHEELITTPDNRYYLECWNTATKQAEFLESLSKKVEAVIVPCDSGWASQTVYLEYKKHRFLIHNRNKHFSCYIRDRKSENWRQKTRENFTPLDNYTFYKMTEKKLLAKLDREIEEMELAKKMEKEAKKAGELRLKEGKKKVDYIAKCLKLKTVTGKRFNSYSVEWNSISSHIHDKCSVGLDLGNYRVSDSGLDDIYKMFKRIKGN